MTTVKTTMRYMVDEALCSAHGQCFAAAPQLFSPDDDGFNSDAGNGWIQVAPESEAAARRGAEACPESAIRVIEDS